MKAERTTVSKEMQIDRFKDRRFSFMNKSFAVLTDIEHHIQGLSELVHVFLNQVETLPTGWVQEKIV